ncbi:MAG: hypothetical protein ABIO60_10265 [Aquaticitalea sp.]
MIEVFKTNITEEAIAESILKELIAFMPNSTINFDLEDCDNILRVTNCSFHATEVILVLNKNGYECQILE